MIYKEIKVTKSHDGKPWRELLVWYNGDLIYKRWLSATRPYGRVMYNFVGE